MKIYVFEVEKWECNAFKEIQKTHDVRFIDDKLTSENAGDFADAEAITTFIYSQLNKDTLDAMPELKLIVSRSTGVDHIDTETCNERGITVCNVPSYGKNTVAEHVFGLLLTISHRLEEAIDRTRKGDFSSRGLTGFDLQGKTLGVIGTGDIGTHTIRIAKGFGMEVLAFDLKPNEAAAQELDFRYVDLDSLLSAADIVTLHVPANPKTHHLIAQEQFEKMKDGAVLINTARGDVVDVRALSRALVEGKIAAAGLDVLPNEPVVHEEAEILRTVYEQKHDLATLLANEVLVHMRNVVVTPHSAFNTREAVNRILDTTIDNLEGFIQGQSKNVVVAGQEAR